MTEFALPKLRARRRKIKPPHPFWWVIVALFGIDLVALAVDVGQVLTDDHPASNLLWGGAFGCWAAYFWPAVKKPHAPLACELDWRLRASAWGCTIAACVVGACGA